VRCVWCFWSLALSTWVQEGTGVIKPPCGLSVAAPARVEKESSHLMSISRPGPSPLIISLIPYHHQYTVPWYATTAARTFGLAGLLKFFIFNTAGAAFPALMLTSGKFVPVGVAQAGVSLVGGALLAALGARLDASGIASRASKGAMVAFLVACVAVAALVAHFTPVDEEMTARYAGWPKDDTPVAQEAGRPVAAPAPLAAPGRDEITDQMLPVARRTAADSDAAWRKGSGG